MAFEVQPPHRAIVLNPGRRRNPLGALSALAAVAMVTVGVTAAVAGERIRGRMTPSAS